ncbi:MAG: sunset domain-containing protein [Arthrobacter sp.]
MDIIFWIILVVIIAAIILWLLNRKRTANPPGGPSAGTGTGGTRTDGALEGGSAAASAQAAGTTGIPTAAGFGRPAEPAAPSTAEEPADSAATSTREAAGGATGTGDQGKASEGMPGQETSGHGTSDSSQEQEERRRQDEAADQAEWETQWSEAGAGSRSGSSTTSGTATPPAASAGTASPETAPHRGAAAEAPTGQPSPATARPVHHDEYTAPHAPTLPGAETAAVESADDAGTPAAEQAGGQAPQHRADTSGSLSAPEGAAQPASAGTAPGDAGAAETLERAQSSALVENGADHHQPSGQGGEFPQGPSSAPGHGTATPEPSGHLAADEPYGAGSAAAGPDGSGPEDYTVKGDAAAMVYYEEGHPDYEQTKAEVWFESAAHAEAAGFRAPRRKRL